MARRIFSIGRRERLIERSKTEFKINTRKRQLYNFFYRKSTFFKTTVILRVIAFLAAFYILNFNELIIHATQEILEDKKVEEFYIWRKTEKSEDKEIYLSTLAGNTYAIGFLESKPDVFLKNDTIDVISNIFGKATFIAKAGSERRILVSKYRRLNNFLVFIAFINLLTLLSADGFDRLYRITIFIVLLLDISAIGFYLFI
jgi:hypothetical protein